MPNSAHQGPHRKTLAIKHSDGEPLTRADLQYDFLHYIFSNPSPVFTDPYPTLQGDPPRSKVTFRDLYINTLLRSPRCSKASREKIKETPAFGDEFAKISLLSNVGRINTTMAFFPEMRTALRTYHPVPSLQKTDGNLQDAPRIKNILKSCFLENESQGVYATPSDVLSRSRCGEVPPTSIVNLIFVFASHAGTIARTHFHSHASLDFLDFFTPVRVSSVSRARAFLWLCYHYHEAPSHNPFCDEHAANNPGQIPKLDIQTAGQAALENVDPPDEVRWGQRMTEQRKLFVEAKAREEEQDKEHDRERTKPRGNAAKNKFKARNQELSEPTNIHPPEPENSPVEARVSLPPMLPGEELLDGPGYVPRLLPPMQPRPPPESRRWSPPPSIVPLQPPPHRSYSPEPFTNPRTFSDPYPRRSPSPASASAQSTNGKATRTRPRHSSSHESHTRQHQFPLSLVPSANMPPSYTPAIYEVPRSNYVASVAGVPRRSMLEQAWHVVMTTDPLTDSDDETMPDEDMRLDYVLRLRIISRLRGKEPTPEPELGIPPPPPPLPLPPINSHHGSY